MISKSDLRIVFMGTPEFAVESLKALVENDFNVVGVVTVADKPAGRGQKIKYSAVKEYAIEKQLKILQPTKLKDEAFLSELKSLNANLQIVVAFRMLPEVVWSMPELGTFNLHGSLLPKYRGAAPINWAVINGDKETGVTTFFLKHEIDTGNIIEQKKVPINETDNAGDVHDRMMVTGAKLVISTLDIILKNELKTIEQESLINNNEIKHAPKIFKQDCKINWNCSNDQVYNKIRGLSPYPAAYTEVEYNGKIINLKIFKTSKTEDLGTPGTINTDNKSYILIYTNDGALKIELLQLAGKRRMCTKEFLNGCNNFSEYKIV